MKFGHNLSRNQVREWASYYINYKLLKKLVKTAAEASRTDGADLDLAEFFFTLDRNVEVVDGFYNKKYAECSRRLTLLYGRYGHLQKPHELDKDEVQEVMGALLELRGQLRKLQWYSEVNRRGFTKITKKFDKKVQTVCIQERYLTSKVDLKPFATQDHLENDINSVNEWLSNIGDLKTFDDRGSNRSASSLGKVPGHQLQVPSDLLDAIEVSLRSDKVQDLNTQLDGLSAPGGPTSVSYQQVLLHILQRAISCRAKQCIDRLLQDILSLDEEDDIHNRNCIHRLVINIGRTKSGEALGTESAVLENSDESQNFIIPAIDPNRQPRPCTTTEEESTKLLSENDDSVQLLVYLLDKLRPEQRQALQSRDSFKRLPLHYAAQYGFVVICEVVIKHMQAWGQFNVSQGIDSKYWQDSEGYAPLHLSVIGGHPLTTKALLEAENWRGLTEEKLTSRKTVSQSGAALILATTSNFMVIVKLLVEAGVDVNYQDEGGETALHTAARFGHLECAKVLIEGSSTNKADIDIPEKAYEWTPLFIACVDNHLPIVEMLVAAGADISRVDNSCWTCIEHAAIRGHLQIARDLLELVPTVSSKQEKAKDNKVVRAGSPPQSSLDERRSRNMHRDNANVVQKLPDPVKSFGHRYLQKETMVLVSLGSMDMRKDLPAVKLDNIPLADAHATQLDTALSIVVKAIGATGASTCIELPVQENISTEPITFTTNDASKVTLLFDIVPTYAGSEASPLGRGLAKLSTIKTSVGSKWMSLQGDTSVPIVAASTLAPIGVVNFNFLIITPFQHPKLSVTEKRTYWKTMADPLVIGHRGLGKNTASRTSLQLGENTIQSFISAANLGAKYVEFDVQLTKDLVPVIYHDFLVSETGIDAPVHTLTLKQFLHIGEGQKPRQSRANSPENLPASNGSDEKDERPTPKRLRSYSVDNTNIHVERGQELAERMKYTRTVEQNGDKANLPGQVISSIFPTLDMMFRDLPESTGFNIEMKYPMLHESEQEDMDQYAIELNSFVDTVLRKVYDMMGKRNPSIPVMFLTDAGTSPVGDIRAASLQEAIRFASRWNLLGVVSAAEPLVLCPRLVKVVKESGLVCVSYGHQNNDVDNVMAQTTEGIDAVIVDSVLKIREGLQAPKKGVLISAEAVPTIIEAAEPQ